MPGQAYMKMLMAHRPHAIVKRVDTSKAEALPGVLTVLTSQDVPCNEFGYYTYDQPVLCGPSEKPYADRVRFVGDRVAAVIAETEAIAAKARDLIEVEYRRPASGLRCGRGNEARRANPSSGCGQQSLWTS